MLRKLLVGAILALPMSAHAGPSIKEGLTSLIGQSETVALDKLGYPTGQLSIGGKTIYVWQDSGVWNMPTLHYAHDPGEIGSHIDYSQTDYVAVKRSCVIRIFVDPATHIIESFEFKGNSCRQYAKAFKPPKKK